MTIADKLKKLENQFEKDGQEIPENIKSWAETFKEAKLYVHLLQFDGMVKFLALLQEDIEKINSLLAGDRNMTDLDRQYRFGEKDAKYQIIQFFKAKEKQLIDIDNRINEELEN